MADDLDQLHGIAASVLDALDAPARRKLLRRLSLDMRRVNQRRMASQKSPEGAPWEKRKPRPVQQAATRPVRFLYPSGGSGEPRLVDMRSWIGRGDMVIGFDREADGMRTFRKDKIIRWVTAEGQADAEGMPAAERGGRGRVRRRAQSMFRGLRSGRWFKSGADPDSAWVEFTERASRIARIHHYGLRARVAPDGPEVDYPERELIGFAPSDEARILNAWIDHAGDALGWGRRAGR